MLPNGTNHLLQFGTQVVQGIEAYGHDLTTGPDSATALRSKLEQLRQAIVAGASALRAKTLAAKRLAIADEALGIWLGKSRLVVMLARGARWSESWIHTGFNDRRTGVPRRLDDRIALARALVSFFARHPEFGVAFAEVTAARGRAIYDRVVQSGEMLQLARTECLTTRQQRDIAESELRDILRQAIASLKTQLPGSDPRWTDFGLFPTHRRKYGSRRSPVRGARPIPFPSHSVRRCHTVAAA
jgi:hypothetical protein